MPYYMITLEAHNGILFKILHIFLNRVQQLHATYISIYEQWRMGVLFTTYAWNSLLIGRKYIIRSDAEIGCIFTFPFDITENIP